MALHLPAFGVRLGLKRSQRFSSNVEGTPDGMPPEQAPYMPIPEQGYSMLGAGGVNGAPRWDGLDGIHGRVPRLFNPNLQMVAGKESMDAANQWGHTVFLPPMEPMQRGGQVRAVQGGSNRASSNSGSQGSSFIPGIFVPVGRR